MFLSHPVCNLVNMFCTVSDSDTLDPSCKIEITKTNYSVSLIDFKDTDYFDTLRIKMGWGKRG